MSDEFRCNNCVGCGPPCAACKDREIDAWKKRASEAEAERDEWKEQHERLLAIYQRSSSLVAAAIALSDAWADGIDGESIKKVIAWREALDAAVDEFRRPTRT